MKWFEVYFVPKTKLTEPKIDKESKNEMHMLMNWHSVKGEKIYHLVPSSLKSAQLPPRQAHSRGPLWMYMHEPRCCSRNESRWLGLGVRSCIVSSGQYGSKQAWLDHFNTEGPWSSLSITLRLSGYSWLRTFKSALLFLPSAMLVVQRGVFTEMGMLMAHLGV